MAGFVAGILEADATLVNVYTTAFRWVAVALAAFLLLRCMRPLLTFRREPEIWAWLCLENGRKLPITHWENVIGRSKRSDIVIDFPTVSRSHAVLTRYDDGSWTISDVDTNNDDGIMVNGEPVDIQVLEPEDTLTIGGIDMVLQPISHQQEQKLAQLRTKASPLSSGLLNALLLTLFQCLVCLGFLLGGAEETVHSVLIGFAGLMLCQWALLLFYVCIRRTAFEVEAIAFFLCTLGMAVIATVAPEESLKQLIATVMGIVLFLLVGWSLRDLERAKQIRTVAAVAGIAFLVITLVFGKEYYGAKNCHQDLRYHRRQHLLQGPAHLCRYQDLLSADPPGPEGHCRKDQRAEDPAGCGCEGKDRR